MSQMQVSLLEPTKTEPTLGDIRKGWQIGKQPKHKFIWQACATCGKERWVSIKRKQPAHMICLSCAMKGNSSSFWKGGRWKHSDSGYISIKLYPDDFFYSMTNSRGYVLEHRLVMAKHLGRCLHRWEIVHHKGTKYPQGSKENRGDNRLENLQLITDDRHKQITILEQRISWLEAHIKDREGCSEGGLEYSQNRKGTKEGSLRPCLK